jgi:hypothetical protein
MIEDLTSKSADETLRVAVLPRRPGRGLDLPDAEMFDARIEGCGGEKPVRLSSCGPPDVTVVQAADSRKSDDLPGLTTLDRARDRRVAVEAHVRPIFVVVGGVLTDQMEGGDARRAPPRERAARAAGYLRTVRRTHFAMATSASCAPVRCPEFALVRRSCAVDSIAVADQPSHVGVVGHSLYDLLCGPRGIGMCRDVDVEDAAAFQRQHEKHVQHLESHGRRREEVDRDGAGEMRPQERSPCCRWRSTCCAGPLRHVFGDCVLADVVAELRELSNDAASAPRRVA